ncbi:MAG: serine protease [Puniceicoccaceae bacterium]|nr:MAG: serine protease [Puniceicoccaceae bacterium]
MVCLLLAMGLLASGCEPPVRIAPRGSEPAAGRAAEAGLDPHTLACLVEVRSEHGSIGSGFVLRWHERFFVITNLHVLAGSERIELRLSNGQVLPPLRFHGAVGHDVAMITIDPVERYLEPASSGEVAASHGREILVTGNSLGGEVFTSLAGRVVGIGARTLEVDARFVSGNSGSPILLQSPRRVIGVASHTTTIELQGRDALSRFERTRWFGYRLDSITQWQELHWGEFSRESRRLAEGEERLREWMAFFEGRSSAVMDRLRADFDAMGRHYHGQRLDGSHWPRRDQALLTSARTLFLRDTRSLDDPAFYDFNRSRQAELRAVRDEIARYMVRTQ